MAMVSMTLRLDEGIKVMWRELAGREGRSMAGYVEWLIKREHEAMEQGLVTLESLDKKLDNVLNKISESKKRTSCENKENKLTAYDVWKDNDTCMQDNWIKWVDHMRKLGKPLNYYKADKQFDTLCDIRDEEWDCDKLIDYLIDKGHGTFYVPAEWRKK